jgi:hypothetical protein
MWLAEMSLYTLSHLSHGHHFSCQGDPVTSPKPCKVKSLRQSGDIFVVATDAQIVS